MWHLTFKIVEKKYLKPNAFTELFNKSIILQIKLNSCICRFSLEQNVADVGRQFFHPLTAYDYLR